MSLGSGTGVAFAEREYGSHFDAAARNRMVMGCQSLAPFIDDFEDEIRDHCVEFGPFLNPILRPERFGLAKVCFIDGDLSVVQTLRYRYGGLITDTLCLNFDDDPEILLAAIRESRNRSCGSTATTRAIVLSQILNYVDYRRFFQVIDRLSSEGTLVFVNNVIDYGIPELFSSGRPESDSAILVALRNLGWTLLRTGSVASPFPEQPNSRLLLVARKGRHNA